MYFANARWLSRGNVVKRFFLLREEVKQFFKSNNQQKYVDLLDNSNFVRKMAYLTDICCILNDLNLRLQGKNLNVIDARGKLKAFEDKLKIWREYAKTKNFTPFPNLNELDKYRTISQVVENHLVKLECKMRHYFPRLDNKEFDWIVNPFVFDIPSYFSAEIRGQLIELKNNTSYKAKYLCLVLVDFWLLVVKEFKQLGDKALRVLTQFATTYRCEQGFSIMNGIKTKKRNRLEKVADEMRVACSTIRPRLDKLCNSMECHPSH